MGLQWLGKLILGLSGWRIEGEKPEIPKYVLIGAPHTSAWDLAVLLAGALVVEVKPAWLGKSELFQFPFGWLLRKLGGIPIHRNTRINSVEQVILHFRQRNEMILAITPEGTRKKTESWKSGFYYIALGANVPIVLGFIDYRRKVMGVGPTLHPSRDIEKDMEIIRGFYSRVTAKYPDQVGEVKISSADKIR